MRNIVKIPSKDREALFRNTAAKMGIWNCRVLQDSTITVRKPEKASP